MCLTNFVVLSWDSVTTASMSAPVSYDITISPSDGVTMMRITNTSYNITELTPATNYTVTVTSRNDVGVGEEAVIMFHIPTVAEAVPKGKTTICTEITAVMRVAACTEHCKYKIFHWENFA